ncbi:hypothetical protein [Vibrio fluvialis]|uniref:hypothetical protein n=1 Tax=Vibrio fluvialis TaxID=676 RepID=UPI001EEAC75C|nr:hypothetical protein [Vibrio fluvialis]MCG6401647.1 hypothetical protein [Vibrio fluvialis]
MHAFVYMLEKEWIEHKAVNRIPLFVLVCVLVLFAGILSNGNVQSNLSFEMSYSGFDNMDLQFVDEFSSLIVVLAGALSIMLSTLYIPKTLRKERQEGSSMFWRSMPVSNLMTHGVKLTFGLLVIPVICSVLVIASDLMFWLVNLTTDDAIPLLMHQRSLLFVLTHWLNYLGLMLLVALALLPLACITLLISQLVNSPILVMFIAVYALKWLSLGLFGSDAVGDFFHQTLALPLNILTDSSLSQVVAQISVANALIYIALGVVSFILSLKCYQTDEVSWRTLLQR